MPKCGNFVCAFSYIDKGKVYCHWNSFDYENLPDCTATSDNSCGQFKYFSCKICGHEYKCFQQRDKGLFYSTDGGFYTPKESTYFAKAVQQNELMNAKRDICATAVRNYLQGYRKSTTVRQLREKYGGKYPEFTKEYILNAVEKSIVKFLEYENIQFKERF